MIFKHLQVKILLSDFCPACSASIGRITGLTDWMKYLRLLGRTYLDREIDNRLDLTYVTIINNDVKNQWALQAWKNIFLY